MTEHSNRNKLIGLLVLAVFFLFALAGTGVWLMRSFMTPAKQIVILAPEAEQQTRLATTPPPPARSARNVPVQTSQPRFKGTVVDAQTKQPVQAFTVHIGYSFNGNNQPPNFGNDQPRDFHGGQYTMSSNMYGGGGMQWTLRIDAKGYLPAISDSQRASGDVNFELQPGKDITGVVLDASGAPVAGAVVGASVPGMQLDLNTAILQADNPGAFKTTTGPDGHFDLEPQIGMIKLAAMTADGFAQVEQDASTANPVLRLAPWGKIQGKLTVAGKPGAKQMIQIYSTSPSRTQNLYVSANQSMTSGDDGSFHFDRVMPGSVEIGRMIQRNFGNNHMQRITETDNINVEAGKTASVNLGGVGRPVIGKLILPTGQSMKNYYLSDNINGTVAPQPADLPPQMPDNVKNGSQATRDIWMGLFSMTAAGKDFLAKHPRPQVTWRQYAMEVADDGTFRIEDVLPGNYRINIFPQMTQGGGRPLTPYNSQFTVPGVPGGGYSDQPVDLGDIKFAAR